MRPKPRDLARFLAVMLTALLALPVLYSYRQTMAASPLLDSSRSDAKPKTKTARPRPNIIAVAPSNDNCANAIGVTGANCPFTDTKDTTDATDEAGEPQSTCTAQANSVWYTFSNPSTDRANVTVDTCGSDFDTAIQVYRVTGAACAFAGFVPVACNDDFGGCGDGFQSSTSFTVLPGEVFKIQVGGFAGETGSLTVNIDCELIACDDIVINGTLGSNDPTFPGPHSSTIQNGRLNRNGIASSCAAPKTCLLFTAVGARAADVYQIPNESGEDACVSVTLNVTDQSGCNLQSNAYLNSYNPNSICAGYLADPGLSSGIPPTPTNFSFVVPAGQTLVLVVHAVDPDTGVGCHYTMTVTGNLCEQFDFCVQDDNVPGRFIKINSTSGAYEFNDCGKGVVFSGTGVVSTSFCKITLSDRGPNPKRPDRSVSVLVNPCTGKGDASIRTPGTLNTIVLDDSNVFDNTCECPAGGSPPPPREPGSN
ncbi:MAG TPA: hypothetical protein VJZ26_03590 [Blastocatellia bacterium]|nr:hypothetical protein [Blastocatellia bacterium]